MAKPKPRVKLPKSASAGEVITIKTLISHKMESGQRKGKDGKIMTRQKLNKCNCEFKEKPVIHCDIEPELSGNTDVEFTGMVRARGSLQLT